MNKDQWKALANTSMIILGVCAVLVYLLGVRVDDLQAQLAVTHSMPNVHDNVSFRAVDGDEALRLCQINLKEWRSGQIYVDLRLNPPIIVYKDCETCDTGRVTVLKQWPPESNTVILNLPAKPGQH